MFARTVSLHLKPNTSSAEFSRTFDHDVLPILRKQKGFQDEITLQNGNEVTAVSLWDRKESAETYAGAGYSEVLKTLGKIIEGTPTVRTSDVVSTTFSKAAAA